MKQLYILALMAMPAVAVAQSAFDAYQLSQTELRGTARFMSMAGAFGALGGDITTLNQNPAGLGVYTGSEVAASVEFDFQRATMTGMKRTQTSTNLNNVGYVGSTFTGSRVMPYFSWGVSYNRLQSFDRSYRGAFASLPSSMTEYMADAAYGTPVADLLGTKDYDPFAAGMGYLTTLGANTGLIVPAGSDAYGAPTYTSLFRDGSFGDATTWTRQSGYVDEYDINFGGNFANMVYWGIGFGIRDLSFNSRTYYDESIGNAYVPSYDYINSLYAMNQNSRGPQTDYNGSRDYNIGGADWGIENYMHARGTGFNMKVGVIIKPINQFRIGLAVHTPTWYRMTFGSNAWVDYDLAASDADGDYSTSNMDGYENPYATTLYGEWSRRMKTPWRVIASAAGVIGGRFIISADYEYNAWQDMRLTMSDDGTLGGMKESQLYNKGIRKDVQQYYKPTHTLRLGAECRLSRHWSARLGYSFKTAPTTVEARSGDLYLWNSGSQTMSEMQNVTENFTCGLGYRYNAFYIDMAYVHQRRNSEWQAFSAFPLSGGNDDYTLASNYLEAPRAIVKDIRNQLVLTIGFKF